MDLMEFLRVYRFVILTTSDLKWGSTRLKQFDCLFLIWAFVFVYDQSSLALNTYRCNLEDNSQNNSAVEKAYFLSF